MLNLVVFVLAITHLKIKSSFALAIYNAPNILVPEVSFQSLPIFCQQRTSCPSPKNLLEILVRDFVFYWLLPRLPTFIVRGGLAYQLSCKYPSDTAPTTTTRFPFWQGEPHSFHWRSTRCWTYSASNNYR